MGRTKRGSREVERWFGTTLQVETGQEGGQAKWQVPEARTGGRLSGSQRRHGCCKLGLPGFIERARHA
jgi:hypothetical protein